MKEKFIDEIGSGYSFKEDSIIIGGAMLEGECQTNSLVKIPLKTLNRHGLIAGATGSGKTKTLQILAEQMSAKGIPSLLMDIKGDLSGIAVKSEGHPKIDERHDKIGIPFAPEKSPVEFLSLSGEKGIKLRATVTEFGPVLLSKILELNNTQSGVIAVAFKYADDKDLPLLDLKDLKKTLQWISKEGKSEIEADFGRISTSTVGAIMRKIVELEQQGADTFFGEKSFEVHDLCRLDENGKGIVSVLRLTDIQDKPKLFSTFMLQMLAEIYTNFPEEGDADQPGLVIFIDEAHLIFKESSKALLDQIETIVKLIRSKGVGLFFVTQNPADIPEAVLGQLGLKIQHALRAFTAKDRKAIKLAAENYPETEFYDTKNIFTKLGIGEAMVTALNEKGIPTPLVHTLLRAPLSRMDVLNGDEINEIIRNSEIIKSYNQEIDRESAYELLTRKIKFAHEEQNQIELQKQNKKAISRRQSRVEKNTFGEILNSPVGKTITRELTRGILGMLGIKTTTRSRRSTKKSGLWF